MTAPALEDSPKFVELSANVLCARLEPLVEHSHCLADAHALMADQVERLLECPELLAADNRCLRTAIRSFARYNRRQAWQHLAVSVRLRQMLAPSPCRPTAAEVASCFDVEDSP